MFDDKPEHSLRLRIISGIALIWAALSLTAVGVDPLVPVAAMVAVVAGHALSWKRRGSKTPIVSLFIGIFIIVIGVYMRTDLVMAIRGDRIPVAFFLLATGAASAFDIKTRAGLYTQLIAAGVVMFFASEIAFGNDFAPLAFVFGIILLVFLALAYIEDEIEQAEVVWFKSRGATTVFWGITGALVVLVSTAAFFLLPWNTPQTPKAPRFTIVPFSGGEQTAISAMTPDLARNAREMAARGAGAGNGGAGEFGDGRVGALADVMMAELNGELTSILELGDQDLSLASRVGIPLEPPVFDGENADTVLHVRSSVASYWRGRTYDQFDTNDGSDGFGRWYATVKDDDPLDRRAVNSGGDSSEGQRYLQSFFPNKDYGDEVITGYDPVAAALPRNERWVPEIDAGSTYQIVSTEPDFGANTLRNDFTAWKGPEYASIPADVRSIHALTGDLTNGVGTDLDKALKVAGYLHQLEYVEDAQNPLLPNARFEEFIYGDAPGTAIDFATAMTLMARAAGLPSRVATGYLPGDYNPLSGASKITEADAHAWSEIYFRGAGWVPFDAAPRPDLPVASSGSSEDSSGLSRLLDMRIGDTVAKAATRTPVALLGTLKEMLKDAMLFTVMSAVAISVTLLAYLLIIHLRQRSRLLAVEQRFARLAGDGRRQIVQAFALAERSAASAGFRGRARSEPISVYAGEAAVNLRDTQGHFDWLARAANQAAYSPVALPSGLADEANDRVCALQTHIKKLPSRSQSNPG
jgi:transglutaminase-like putative cysteine protease